MKTIIELAELNRLRKCERVCQSALEWAMREAAARNPHPSQRRGEDPTFDALTDTVNFLSSALSK